MPTGVYERRRYSKERLAQIVAMGKMHQRHGHSVGYKGSRTYDSWRAMIQRCTNPNRRSYRWYGARGITICERWRHSFDNFLADMGERPDGKSLDRMNADGNYEPGNCRWATKQEQMVNRRSFCGIGPRWRDGSFHSPKRLRSLS